MADAAIALAPASAPLCAMEIANDTPADRWRYETPGTLDGKVIKPVGTTQDTSPESVADIINLISAV